MTLVKTSIHYNNCDFLNSNPFNYIYQLTKSKCSSLFHREIVTLLEKFPSLGELIIPNDKCVSDKSVNDHSDFPKAIYMLYIGIIY